MATNSPDRAVYTIGHSTRTIGEFLTLLMARGISQLADIRSIARSRRNPQFASDAPSNRSQPAAWSTGLVPGSADYGSLARIP